MADLFIIHIIVPYTATNTMLHKMNGSQLAVMAL